MTITATRLVLALTMVVLASCGSSSAFQSGSDDAARDYENRALIAKQIVDHGGVVATLEPGEACDGSLRLFSSVIAEIRFSNVAELVTLAPGDRVLGSLTVGGEQAYQVGTMAADPRNSSQECAGFESIDGGILFSLLGNFQDIKDAQADEEFLQELSEAPPPDGLAEFNLHSSEQ
jgi:hypothetical protein